MPGTALALDVDHARRGAIRQNHSATHLLHEALRQVLGDHVAQKGSLVAPDRLRFDFSHPKPMSGEEIERVEDIANDFVLQNSPVTTRVMALDDARASGARALFGEKYGDEVRVVAMGEGGGNTLGWSVELCGGTHVRRTGDIGIISVVGETGGRLRRAPHRGADRRMPRAPMPIILRGSPRPRHPNCACRSTRCRVASPRCSTSASVSNANCRRRRKKLAMGGGGESDGADGVRTVGDVKLMARAVEGIDLKDLRSLADEGKKQVGSGVVAIVGVTGDGKAGIVVGVTNDLVARFNAVDLVRKAPRCSAARAAADGRTWRKPAAPTAPRPSRAGRDRSGARRARARDQGGGDGQPLTARRSFRLRRSRNGSSARRASMSLLICVRMSRFGRIWPRWRSSVTAPCAS